MRLVVVEAALEVVVAAMVVAALEVVVAAMVVKSLDRVVLQNSLMYQNNHRVRQNMLCTAKEDYRHNDFG